MGKSLFRRLFTSQMFLLVGLLVPLGIFNVALYVDPDYKLRATLIWVTTLGGGTIIALFLSHRLVQQINRPLAKLADYLRAFRGDEGKRYVIEAEDQTANVIEAINGQNRWIASRITELEGERQQLTAILSAMVEGVIALNSEQRILFANERALRLLNVRGQSIEGKPLWYVVRQRPLLDVVSRSLESTEPQQEEIEWAGSDTEHLIVHAVRLPGTPTRGLVVVLHDTTALRRLERLRQDFVANVSHELKTPLSVIKAHVETLIGGAIDDLEHRSGFLAQIERQADRLHTLILDMLSLAKVEAGREVYDFVAVPVEPMLETFVNRFGTRAQSKGQALELLPSLTDGLGIEMWVDKQALEEIFDNLLDNALKYTPEGGTISVGWGVSDEMVRVTISDNGIGIPRADLSRIFERFYRVDKARSREMGGTGLGLAIVKHLVHAMEGSIEAESEVGQGSSFSVTLPRVPDGAMSNRENHRKSIASSSNKHNELIN